MSKIILDCLSDLGNHIFKPLQINLKKYFKSSNFFKSDPKTLSFWGKIQTICLTFNQNKILDSLISKLNFSSVFKNKKDEEIIQTKALQRISFIIFAQ